MSIYLALDKATNDLILKVGGGLERVQEGRFVVQQVRCKLRTRLGEWLLDESVGWISFTDFERNFDQFGLETRAREIILSTNGVQSITELSTYYSNRKLTITFKALTIYGEIELTVPWGV